MSDSNDSEWSAYTQNKGHKALLQLEDGTKVRHKYRRGEYAGKTAEAVVKNGHIVYNNNEYSPTGAAREANYDTIGREYEVNGWKWWKYYDEVSGEWRKLSTLR